jgi:cell division protein FtsW
MKTLQPYRKIAYDAWFLFAVVSLVGMGLVMVTSASLAYAEGSGMPAWYFGVRHALYLMAGGVLCFSATTIPLVMWQRLSVPLLILILSALALLLVPGISREVNGSIRWLFLGPVSIQVSECAKLILILYMARYLIRQQQAVQTEVSGFLKPMILLALVSVLLLLEPDFGAVVVIGGTVMGMLFLGGVPFRRFLVLFILGLVALAILSVSAPYRIQRLTGFLDPWRDQFDTGYQLTQALIAFGRGGWFGVGLGNGIQKLFYLPEPHTDFIYAVLAEELGLIGALTILLIFALLVSRILDLGKQAMLKENKFAGFVAYGIGLWFSLQAIINIGVNVGVLPTKGLTLPFISYGGSSLMVSLLAVGILLRIDFEIFSKKSEV